MACKCKLFPHNWFCLKGIYWIFVTLFYLTIGYGIYGVTSLTNHPMLSGQVYYEALTGFLINVFSFMLIFITVAKIVLALAKIKQAVAPCCCHQTTEEVVVVSSQEK